MNKISVKPYLLALAVSAGLSLLIILISAALLVKAETPESYVAAISPAAVFAGALGGGIVCAKKSEGRGSVAGLINGIAFAAIILLVGVFVEGGGFTWQRLVYIAAVILVSFVGGKLAGKKKSLPRKTKKLSKKLIKR